MHRGFIGVVAAAMALAAGSGTAWAAQVGSDYSEHAGGSVLAEFSAGPGENNDVTVSGLGQGTAVFHDPNAVIRNAPTGFYGHQQCLLLGTHDAACRIPWFQAALVDLEPRLTDGAALRAYVARVAACLGCDPYDLVESFYGSEGAAMAGGDIGHGIYVGLGDGTNRVRFAARITRWPFIDVGSGSGAASTTAVVPSSEATIFNGSGDVGPDNVTIGNTREGGFVETGNGNDTINVRNGSKETVSCGPGDDTVIADAIDVVDASCEHVTRG